MSRRIHIGLLARQFGWETLLQQSGLSWEIVASLDNLQRENFSTVIANSPLDNAAIDALTAYARGGGAVLDNSTLCATLGLGNPRRSKVRTCFAPVSNPLFDGIDLIDIYGEWSTLSATPLTLLPLGSGWVAFLGIDVNAALSDTRALRKAFYRPLPPPAAASKRRYPSEITARVSKGAIRRLTENLIRQLHFASGLPYVHRWHFPGNADNIFAFRIDSDGGSKSQVDAFYDAARRHNMVYTWFLHGEAHESWMGHFSGFAGHEMAVHGYRHHTFATEDANRENIERCKSLLTGHQLPFSGFAAPYGSWHLALARAIGNAQFDYSSEFSLDYDNLPFFPPVDGAAREVLQIPIHPICIGSMINARMDDDEMKAYFRYMLQGKLAAASPAIFYDHPRHERLAVLDDLFAQVTAAGIPNITLGAYARWWRRRLSTPLKAVLSGRKLQLEFPGKADMAVNIVADDTHCRRITRPGRIDLTAGEWQPAPLPTLAPEDIREVRRFNPRLRYHAWLDYYRRRIR